jgi:hypothetical protein
MKTKAIILVVVAIAFFSFQIASAQQTVEKQNTTIVSDTTKINYTCPMHSEIVSNKPGTCPKCGMELVKQEKGKTQSEPMKHNMGSMMGPMHGKSDMDQNSTGQKSDNMNMMKGMGIFMGIMMVIMMVVILF